jgi:hypothetical protein
MPLQPGLRTVEVAGAQIEEARFGGRTLGLGDLRPGQAPGATKHSFGSLGLPSASNL